MARQLAGDARRIPGVLSSVRQPLRHSIFPLAVAAGIASCAPFRIVEALKVGAFVGDYHLVALDSATNDLAFTGHFTLVANGDSLVGGSGTLSNRGDVRVFGVVRGDTLDAGMSRMPDVGICVHGILNGSDLTGSWVACGFPPQPPPHGTFTAHRS